MKLKFIYTLFIAACFFIIFSSNSSGRAATEGAGNTGAPGESTCNSCHNGASFSTTTSIKIEDSNSVEVSSYEPGKTYEVKVKISASGGTPSGYGFQMVSLLQKDNSNVNNWADPSSNANIKSANNRTYVEHPSRSSTNEFKAKWQAPIKGSGEVIFYASGNGVNGNGNTSGDAPSNTSFSLKEALASSAQDIATLPLSITLFPNPTTQSINIKTIGELEGSFRLNIIDFYGKKILEDKINLNLGTNLESIDVTSLASGLYILEIFDTKSNAALNKLFIKH